MGETAKRRPPRGERGQLPFSEGAATAGLGGRGSDELGETVEFVLPALEDGAQGVFVVLRDVGERGDQEIVESREVVGGQAGGSAGFLRDGAVGDPGRAVTLDDAQGGGDQFGTPTLSACASTIGVGLRTRSLLIEVGHGAFLLGRIAFWSHGSPTRANDSASR